jgi:hypothetical protein
MEPSSESPALLGVEEGMLSVKSAEACDREGVRGEPEEEDEPLPEDGP